MNARTRASVPPPAPPEPAETDNLTLGALIQIAALRIPRHPTAFQSQVNSRQAREWVTWAAAACGIAIKTATLPAMHAGYYAFADETRKQWRGACGGLKGPRREAARQLHKDRCKVAWHMANVPHPTTGKVASTHIIAFAMNWKAQGCAVRAIRAWQGIIDSQNKGSK